MSEQNEQAKKIRWGILGAARINRRMIPGIKGARNAELLGIASRTLPKATELAQEHAIPMAFPSYETLLADSQIDAVYIPLPNSLHVEWILRALEAGKHVLSEKPLALTPAEVHKVEQAAQDSGKLVMEGFMYRFHPQHARVRELLAAGEIGELRLLHGTFSFVIGTQHNIRLENRLGGGATWDVGCYGINVARWMFGAEPRSVYGQGTLENGIDISAVATLEFGNGRRAVLNYGMNYGRRSFYEIIGTKGSISVENIWQEPENPGYVYVRTDSQGLRTEEFPITNHFVLEAEAFSQAILDSKPAPYPLGDTAANVQVCQAVIQSIQSGKPVEVKS